MAFQPLVLVDLCGPTAKAKKLIESVRSSYEISPSPQKIEKEGIIGNGEWAVVPCRSLAAWKDDGHILWVVANDWLFWIASALAQ